MADCEFEKPRNDYKPDHIRVLLIGESRPKSGKFFYFGNSVFYKETERAFNEYFAQNIFTLDKFKQWNCWLYDICDEPINGSPKNERKNRIHENIPRLVELVRKEEPKCIIVCKKGFMENEIKESVVMGSYKIDENIFFLPFPAFGNQKNIATD